MILLKKFNLSSLVKQEINWNFKNFLKNIKNDLKSDLLKSKLKKIKYFFNIYSDKEKIQKKELEFCKDINKNLISILNIVSRNEYKGNIKKENILKIAKINLNDFQEKIKFNHYSYKEKIIKKLNSLFKSSQNNKLGLNKKITNIYENINNKHILYEKWIEKEKELQKEDLLYENNFLDSKFIFSWVLKNKSNSNIKDKNTKDNIHSEFKKIFSILDTEEFEKFIFLIKNKDIWKILNYSITDINKNISLDEFYYIYFISSFGKQENYIPSTGEYDMMKIEKFLEKDQNLVIDEFCNTLDNDYVYNKLIPKLKKFNGQIIASTHNPIISSVAFCQKYIYKLRENDLYKRFESNNSIYGKFYDTDIIVKDQIIKTIEGSKEAFKIRKEKYEI